MSQNGLRFEQVSREEKLDRQEKLAAIPGTNVTNVLRQNYYKVPFAQALGLVKHRQVFLEAGWAYVPLSNLVSIIVTRFRMHLSRALVVASNSFHMVGDDSRIGPLLKNMNKQVRDGGVTNIICVIVIAAATGIIAVAACVCFVAFCTIYRVDYVAKWAERLR
jgi:DNA primase large subunit